MAWPCAPSASSNSFRPPATPVTLPSLHFLRYFQLSSTSMLCICCSTYPVHFSLHSLHLVYFYFGQDGDIIVCSGARTPAFGIKLSFNPYSSTHQLDYAKLNKLLRSPRLSFLTYMWTWAHISQIIHVKHSNLSLAHNNHLVNVSYFFFFFLILERSHPLLEKPSLTGLHPSV